MSRGELEKSLAKWSVPGAGSVYAERRFASRRAAARDPQMVARALARYGWSDCASLLDVPCGTTRVRAGVRDGALYVGADISSSMLQAAAHPRVVQADVYRLPFADQRFEVVLCCRLLHHVTSPLEFVAIARELLRVARRGVVASFWDANSLPNWRARLGLRRAQGETRIALPRERVSGLFAQAGGEVLGFEPSLRFISQQTFVAVRPTSSVQAPDAQH